MNKKLLRPFVDVLLALLFLWFAPWCLVLLVFGVVLLVVPTLLVLDTLDWLKVRKDLKGLDVLAHSAKGSDGQPN